MVVERKYVDIIKYILSDRNFYNTSYRYFGLTFLFIFDGMIHFNCKFRITPMEQL